MKNILPLGMWAFFAFFLLPLSGLNAATIIVMNTNDSGPGSLRQAVATADSGDDIRFSGATNGTTIFLTSGEILIDKDLTIIGRGVDRTIISGSDNSRIFNVTDGEVSLRSARLMDGNAGSGGAILVGASASLRAETVEFIGNVATGPDATMGGGAIANMGGRVSVSVSSVFDNNQATGASGSGGAIINGAGGSLNVSASTFSSNSSSRAGGAIEDVSGDATTVKVTNVNFFNNNTGPSPGNGGAIHISGNGSMDIVRGRATGNRATREGGAFWNNAGTMVVRSVLIANNEAAGPAADDGGGGLFNNGGTMRVNFTTLRNNVASGASGSGGGIFNADGGTLSVSFSTLSANQSARAGGGIEDASGSATTVVINSSQFEANTTGPSPGNGGAIHISGDGDMEINGGKAVRNQAAREGGGFWNNAGTMTVNGTLIEENEASGDSADDGGGGLFNNGGTLVVTAGTTIKNNSASGASGSGGGIFNADGGMLSVSQATISGNSASRAGGGIEDASGNSTTVSINRVQLLENVTGPSPGNGGGIHISGDGNMNISGGRALRNRAAREGGALWNGTGTMTTTGIFIAFNRAMGDAADDGGGGIFNNGGDLRVGGSTIIRNNSATGASGSGGGIFNATGGSLTVNGAFIHDNRSSRAGGGIEDASGDATLVTVTDTEFRSNVTGPSPGNGGAIHISGNGSMNITGGLAKGNLASREGGGFWNNAGTMTVMGTKIEENEATGDAADDGGGGIFNNGGSLVVLEGTLIDNNKASGAAGSGGGIFNAERGELTVEGATIRGNTSSRAGGGIEDLSGEATTVMVKDVLFDNNFTGPSPGNGGAIHITGKGNIRIEGGRAVRNGAAREGGAFWNGTGDMLTTGVNILNNRALGDAADDGGGGIFNNGGNLTVDTFTFLRDNVALGASGSGGGVFNAAGGTLTVNRSFFTGNWSSRAGGAIEDASGDATVVNITDSEFRKNFTGSAPGNGGAVHVTGNGDINISGGIATENIAKREGGAFWNGRGTMVLSDVEITDNLAEGDEATQGGGGVFALSGGTLEVRDSCLFSGNHANGFLGSGGGILIAEDVFLTVEDTRFLENIASRAGGGIEDQSGANTTSILTNVEFIRNLAASANNPTFGNGGAVHITGPGNMDIQGGKAAFNYAGREGGGYWNGSGLMVLDQVNIHDNIADGGDVENGGGGLFNNGGTMIVNSSSIWKNHARGVLGNGGGIFNDAGTVTLSTSTVSGNRAYQGGGIWNLDNTDISNSTIANNRATTEGGGIYNAGGTVTVGGSIVATNTAANSNNDLDGNAVSSNDYNLIGEDNGAFPAPGANDQVGSMASPLDPKLDVLAANGADLPTHALFCNSPAIDANDPTDMSVDQRGLGVAGAARDIGAFESQVDECEDETEEDLQDVVSRTTVEVADETPVVSVDTEGFSSVFPNPSRNGETNLVLPGDFDATVDLHIMDVSGKVLSHQQLNGGVHRIRIPNSTPGIYLLRVVSGDRMETHRLVIK